MKLRISGKIGAVFTGMTLMLVLCGSAGFYAATLLDEGLKYVTTTAWDAADGAMEGVISTQKQIIALNQLASSADPKNAAEQTKIIREAQATANEALDRMANTGLLGDEMTAKLHEMRSKFDSTRDNTINAYAAFRNNPGAGTSTGVINANEEFKAIIGEFLGFLSELEKVGSSTVESYTQKMADVESKAFSAIIITVVIGIVIAIAAFMFIKTSIIKPIQIVAKQLIDIAEGEGDLTVSLPEKGHDEITDVARGFNLFVQKIRNSITEVMGSATQLNTASSELSTISNETSAILNRQQSETEQVATAMNEMVATVQEVSRNVTDAAESADAANTETESGKQIVTKSISEINDLAKEVEHAAEVLARLETDTDNVSTVLDVIKDIADQTNLLALNAAIEAARAGEQGRGFAVVADEVRTLASRTQQSTEEIHQMIEKLQSGAR